MAKQKPPSARSDEEKFSTPDTGKFLDAWLTYLEQTPDDKQNRNDWADAIVSEFEADNPKSKRTQDQKRKSVLTKALYVRKRLTEAGHPTPPIPGGVSRRIGDVVKSGNFLDRLSKYN